MGQPLPISRIMHTGVLLQCELDTTIADAAARMSETSVSSILGINSIHYKPPRYTYSGILSI